MAEDYVELRIHLASGSVIEQSVETDEDPEDVIKSLSDAIEELGRPNWLLIDSTLVFTGAVSAIEAL